MTSGSTWSGYKAEVLARCPDFAIVYADLQPQTRSGDEWSMTRCPFHDDAKPSFAYHHPTGAWKCHAGCGEGDVFRFLMLTLKTDFRGALSHLGDLVGVPLPGTVALPEACYAYQDEAGTVLFEVVRLPGKRFRQRRPDGHGGWEWKLDGVRRVLYRLPDLTARRSEPVYIVEGEKDADRLQTAGRLATTNPGGAGKWKDAYNSSLHGRDVIILPDNDVPGRDHATQVARALRGTAASVRVVELPDLSEKGDVSDWLAAGHTLEQLEALVARAPDLRQDEPQLGRPRVQVNDRQLRDIIADAWQVLLPSAAELRLFRGTGGLVRIVGTESDPQVALLEEAEVYGLLARQADWIVREGPDIRNARPPKDLARDMLALPDPAMPILEGIVTAPVFTPRGELLTQSGYHAASRLWYAPMPGFVLPPIPETPSEAEVDAALGLLTEDLFVDFPFTAESDEAHALAALLLPFVRRLIPGCAPIHLIEAPTPGSGKSLLADLISTVARGRACEATTLTRDENEARKKITALLSRGAPIVLVDNVRSELDSSQLAAALMAEIWSDRILGQTRMVEFPSRATWLVTANNPKLSLEIARRSIRIRLEPREERPWERDGFKHDPVRKWAQTERASLVAAVLTLVQNWLAKGQPPGERKLGSFEVWARTIGGILRCAGVRDFLGDTQEFYAAADADSQEWHAFVEAWAEAHGTSVVSASELVKLAEQNELLGGVLGDKGAASQRIRLGRALLQQRDRQFGDYRIVAERSEHAKASRYRLTAIVTTLFGCEPAREVAGNGKGLPAALPARNAVEETAVTPLAGSRR